MNDFEKFENYSHSNVKILVRIRNHPIEKDNLDDTQESHNRLEKSSKSFTKEKDQKSRSKSPSAKTSSPILKSPTLDETKKYTIFTSHTPSSSLVISEKPITGKLINNTFINENDIYEYSYSILTDASILQYERVYNETHKVEQIYNEQVKESINNLFLGKNSCISVFGPTNSGKSFILRGGNEGKTSEVGLLGRSINDLFNLVEISKQANMNSKSKGAYFAVKVSVYQVYMNEVNDLLSASGYTKNLKIEKFYDDQNQMNTQIVDLTQKEVKNKRDYDSLIRDAMNYRKLLAQYLKVNEMKRKSHLVISLILEKREKLNDSHYPHSKSAEKAIDRYAQLDFVELASSNFGVKSCEENKPLSLEDKALYKNTSKTFNSLCNNIVCASVGSAPKSESKLTLALKSSLRREGQITFISCVLPYEVPLNASYKCLKFTNWLRNQVSNIKMNSDYKIKSQFEDSEEGEEEIEDGRYVDKRMNSRDYSDMRDLRDASVNLERRNMRYGKDKKEYLEDEERAINMSNMNNVNTHYSPSKYSDYTSYKNYLNYNYEDDIIDLRNHSRERPERLHSSNEENSNDIRTRRRPHKEVNEVRDRERSNSGIKSIRTLHDDERNIINEPKEQKLRDMEKSLKDLEAKSVEISRCIEHLRVERTKNEDSNPLHTLQSVKSNFDYDLERLKHENSTLKSDNIIFREDISRLTDVNRHLEDELSRQRNRNLEIAADNERLNQDKLILKTELDKTNENFSRVKMQEHSIVDQMNQRFMFENKIRELESDNRNLREEKQKYEVEYRVISERHNELKKQFENSEGELNFIKTKQTEEVNNIESKLEKMAKEIEYLQRENNNLRVNEERLRTELISMEKQRDNYRDKYQDYKSKNNILNTKLNEIEDEFRKLMLEKQVESYEKKKEEECKKMKIDSKQKILEDMQSRILNYKTELLRQRNKKEDF